MRWIILLVVFCTFSTVFAQVPDTLWTRTYGSNGNDTAEEVRQTVDGGFIIVGVTESNGSHAEDCYLIKTDGDGNTIWSRTYGVLNHNGGESVQQTSDGGFILAGWAYDVYSSGWDIYVVKTDTVGDTLWTRRYGSSFETDLAHSIQQTADGGYIIAGRTDSYGAGQADAYLVKTDNAGNTQWERTYGGGSADAARSVEQTSDGGYIVAGYTSSFGVHAQDAYLIRTNHVGDTLWTRTFGDLSYNYAHEVHQASDGGFIFAGYTQSGWDFYVVKTDYAGNTEWTRRYGGAQTDLAHAIWETQDGGYIVVGRTDTFGNADVYLIKIDNIGDEEWTRIYGGNSDDAARSVQQTDDGGYIVAGYTRSFGSGQDDFHLLRLSQDSQMRVLSPNGGEEWRILQNDTVRWSAPGYVSAIRIHLNRDYPQGTWEIIIDSTDNDGVEEVLVTDPLSSNCRVRVSKYDGSDFDISNSNFSIISSQGYLTLVDPLHPEGQILLWNAGVVECPRDTSRTFFLKNFGLDTTIVFAPTIMTGLDFSVGSNCPPSFIIAPGEISTCSLSVTFDPLDNGIHKDTILIITDAVNAQNGYLPIPLLGQQISTPATPQITIIPDGIDARLIWNPITESILGCPVTITAYLAFYSPNPDGPYYFNGYASDTTYTHSGVIRFADGMFYEMVAYAGSLQYLDSIILKSERLRPTLESMIQTQRELHPQLWNK